MSDHDTAGRVMVQMKDGNAWRFALDDAPAVLEAFDKGRAFVTGTGPHGERLTLKLAGAECVVVWSEASIAARLADDAAEREADRQRALLEGEP